MVKIVNYEFSEKKNIFSTLSQIYGISFKRAYYILMLLGIDLTKKIEKLTSEEMKKINDYLLNKDKTIDVELKYNVKENIKNKVNIFSYQGSKHKQHLPVRGQRTRTNSKTAKKQRKKV